MHRTQIYLDESLYQILRSRAKRESKTISAVIRDILGEFLGCRPPAEETDPFDAVIGAAEGDGSRVAENYEDYLYGEPR
jgi:hypothetical protein